MIGGAARPRERSAGRIRIVGLGADYRRDDGAGTWVARQVAAEGWEGVDALALESGDLLSVLTTPERVDCLFLVDAVASGAPPGTILRVDPGQSGLPADLRALSTHGVSVADAIELARTLGTLPPCLVVYGIVGRDFGYGRGLSLEVAKAAERVLEQLRGAARAGCHGEENR